LGFAFLLRKESDFIEFKEFLNAGKRRHKGNWLFSTMDTKPEYMKSRPKPKKSNNS
jgi:hypothetical protein